jgi:anti-sigma B factor antagonist
MISLLRRAREKKGDVKVCGVNREIKEIFEITRLHRLFEISKNVEEAVQKF